MELLYSIISRVSGKVDIFYYFLRLNTYPPPQFSEIIENATKMNVYGDKAFSSVKNRQLLEALSNEDRIMIDV